MSDLGSLQHQRMPRDEREWALFLAALAVEFERIKAEALAAAEAAIASASV